MNTVYRTEQVSKEASEWVGIVSDGGNAEGLLAWARKSPDHVGKYLLLSVIPALARDHESVQNIDREQLCAEARAYVAATERKARLLKVWAVAASIVAVTVLGAVLTYRSLQPSWILHDTTGKPAQVVSLEEGSTIDMATNTVLRVRVDRDTRAV
jgi:ferric-dicitrate binding protein FerR (iron transport regulator)